MTYVLAASFVPTSRKEAFGVRLMLKRFLHHRGHGSVDRWWAEAVEYRSADRNLTPREAAKLQALRQGRPGA
jgi:hypothetical protein